MKYFKETRYDFDAVKTFKAGDFTKGKMSNIFSECFHGQAACARISHNQHGDAYLMPVYIIKLIALSIAGNDDRLSEYILCASDHKELSMLEASMDMHDDYLIHVIGDHFETELNSWHEVLILLTLRNGFYP